MQDARVKVAGCRVSEGQSCLEEVQVPRMHASPVSRWRWRLWQWESGGLEWKEEWKDIGWKKGIEGIVKI